MSAGPREGASQPGSPSQPKLRMLPHHAISLEGDVLQVYTGRITGRVKGPSIDRLFERVVRLLDGTRTEQEVIEAVGTKESVRKATKFLLHALSQNRMLEQLPADGSPAEGHDGDELGNYFAVMTLNRLRPLAALRTTRVAVLGEGRTAETLARALARLSVKHLTASPWPASLSEAVQGQGHIVALTSLPVVLDERLDELNNLCIASGTPFTVVSVAHEHTVQIGPTVFPSVSACLSCVSENFRRANPFPDTLEHLREFYSQARKNPPTDVSDLAASVAALEVMRAVTKTRMPASAGAILTVDLESMRTRRVPYTKVPRCPDCGFTRNTPPLRIWS